MAFEFTDDDYGFDPVEFQTTREAWDNFIIPESFFAFESPDVNVGSLDQYSSGPFDVESPVYLGPGGFQPQIKKK